MAFSKTEALDFLTRAHEQQRLAHAYLITGPAGAGKRQLASDLFALVNNLPPGPDPLKHPDVHIVEPESKSRVVKIEQIRELERELQMRPNSARHKAGIVIDADRMNPSASNSFLKTLEEPPAQSLLLLLSENPAQLLDTILSRCVTIQLRAPERTGPTETQRRLLDALAGFFKTGKSGAGEIFSLAREFSSLLAESKSAIVDTNEAALKHEQNLYKQTTESAKWLEDREDYYKALNESRYLQQRFTLVDTLVQWWADALRQQQGGAHPDLPDYTAETAELAARYSTPDILKRITHLDELRENFNRNVLEALAVEVAFLRAFSAPGGG
jgi:DNA polymerase-3 subunit delta'